MASSQDAVAVYVELSSAIGQLQARGLHQSVKWAAEQLVGLPEEAWEPGAAQAAKLSAQQLQPEHPKLVQGRNYFELKEYTRAAHVLSGLESPVALFLRCYALFLAGEKQKEQERIESSGPLGTAPTTNPHLDVVESELAAAAAQGISDGFTAYLAALLEVEREHKARARDLLVQSVNAFPCHWGAWQALIGLCEELEVVSTLGLPNHWATNFFIAGLCLELQANAEALSRLQLINQTFPGSDWVTSQAALAHYNCRNFDTAQALYEDLLERDPWRLQGMDTYSNILFVKEAFGPLSHLAHRLAVTDKFTPEACCVVGNYYSLKGQHERSVEWFRRALRLCRTYLSAWTLMGHEFVEMKNAPAAIDAYRNAVSLNPRDYRAWYGLGQTYELLSMPHYALHYYRRAALLRPTDPRMWCALGHCYEAEGLALPGLALRCYRRAVAHGDREGIGIAKLAKLHEAQGERAAAAHYYAFNLARLDAEGVTGADATEALLYLAEYAKDNGMFTDAESYCQRLMDVGGPANMRAKAILRDMRSSSNTAAAAEGSSGGGSAAASGSSGGRVALGARRVLGDAGRGSVSGPPSWIAQALGEPRRQQQQQQTPGQAPQQTAGGVSMVLEDDDDIELLLTGGPSSGNMPAADAAAAPAAASTPGFTPGSSGGQLDMLHPSTGLPLPSFGAPQQQQQQQRQRQVTPIGFGFGSGVTPASDTVSMSATPTPNFDHLLRPAYQQPFQQPVGADSSTAAAAGNGGSWVTPPSAYGGGRGGGRGGRGGGLAAALYATPPDSAGAGSPSAARGGGRGGRGGRGAPAAPARTASRTAAAAGGRGGVQPAAAAAVAAAATGRRPSFEGEELVDSTEDIDSLMAETGADSGTAAAALMAAGGDLMQAAAQIRLWCQQQQQQQQGQ